MKKKDEFYVPVRLSHLFSYSAPGAVTRPKDFLIAVHDTRSWGKEVILSLMSSRLKSVWAFLVISCFASPLWHKSRKVMVASLLMVQLFQLPFFPSGLFAVNVKNYITVLGRKQRKQTM
ncbi:hypothetical protein A4G20_04740 [Pasteurellaceae bacterium RH1A]|nr:hypothetical protein A4G20_04740 [Pasteurellaceae bacterium RH1A]